MSLVTIIVIHELLCAALFYSVFCRAVPSCKKVRADVRFAFWVLGVAACAGMSAPLVWGLVPDVWGLALLAAVVLVQLVTAHHWSSGVPERFYRPECRPRRRRKCDIEGGCKNAS